MFIDQASVWIDYFLDVYQPGFRMDRLLPCRLSTRLPYGSITSLMFIDQASVWIDYFIEVYQPGFIMDRLLP
jgi:hypothetical protein